MIVLKVNINECFYWAGIVINIRRGSTHLMSINTVNKTNESQIMDLKLQPYSFLFYSFYQCILIVQSKWFHYGHSTHACMYFGHIHHLYYSFLAPIFFVNDFEISQLESIRWLQPFDRSGGCWFKWLSSMSHFGHVTLVDQLGTHMTAGQALTHNLFFVFDCGI
jgi:hypothetical protein